MSIKLIGHFQFKKIILGTANQLNSFESKQYMIIAYNLANRATMNDEKEKYIHNYQVNYVLISNRKAPIKILKKGLQQKQTQVKS